jgi:hypothetical protein
MQGLPHAWLKPTIKGGKALLLFIISKLIIMLLTVVDYGCLCLHMQLDTTATMFMQSPEHPPCMTSKRDYICPDMVPEETLSCVSSSASAAAGQSSTQDPSPDTPTSSATAALSDNTTATTTTAAAAAAYGRMFGIEVDSQHNPPLGTPTLSAHTNAGHVSSSGWVSSAFPAASSSTQANGGSSSNSSSSGCDDVNNQAAHGIATAAAATARRTHTRKNSRAKQDPKHPRSRKAAPGKQVRSSTLRNSTLQAGTSKTRTSQTRTKTHIPGVYRLGSGRLNVVLSVGTKKVGGHQCAARTLTFRPYVQETMRQSYSYSTLFVGHFEVAQPYCPAAAAQQCCCCCYCCYCWLLLLLFVCLLQQLLGLGTYTNIEEAGERCDAGHAFLGESQTLPRWFARPAAGCSL